MADRGDGKQAGGREVGGVQLQVKQIAAAAFFVHFFFGLQKLGLQVAVRSCLRGKQRQVGARRG